LETGPPNGLLSFLLDAAVRGTLDPIPQNNAGLPRLATWPAEPHTNPESPIKWPEPRVPLANQLGNPWRSRPALFCKISQKCVKERQWLYMATVSHYR